MSERERAERLFNNKLLQIASRLTKEEFEQLLFCCSDIIPDGQRERLGTSLKFFQELKKRGKLALDNRDFLVELLNNIGHKKLADELHDLNLEYINERTLEKIQILKDHGRLAFKDHKFKDAQLKYGEALHLIPQNSHNTKMAKERKHIMYQWIHCLIRQGQENSKLTYFQEAHDSCVDKLLNQDPEDIRAKLLLVKSLIGLGQLEQAHKELEILNKVKPNNPEVLLLLKEVSRIKFGEHDNDDPSAVTIQDFSSSLGGAYPRKLLLVCDKWSGWHLSIYAVNRHLCQSFGKQKGVEVVCLVLNATETECRKAKRNNVHIVKAVSRSGIPTGDKKLLFMHDFFPFGVPDLVIGHGMITGAEAAELARKLKCRYLQILYDSPEEFACGDNEIDAQKQAELGRDADFVAAIGPLLAQGWCNKLNRDVMEIVPGIPNVTERSSIPTPNNRCVIVQSDEEHKVGEDFAVNALKVCKKRSKPINVTIQGAPRSKKEALLNDLKCELRQNFNVQVTSHDASIESVRGDISIVSLMMMPKQSHEFGVRGLEAINAGVPILVSNTYGLAHILLKHFDEKFWKFICPTDEDDDYEAWSDRIDSIFDDRDEYFQLASELKQEWSKRFSWDAVTSEMIRNLSNSGCFTNILDPSISDDHRISSSPTIHSSEAYEFVKKELQLNEKGRKHILILSPNNCQGTPSISSLAKVPWISVFDFDVESSKTGILASCEDVAKHMGLKVCRVISPSEPEERKRKAVLPNGVPWILLEGITDSKRNMNKCLDWLKSIIAYIECSYQAPISILVLWNSCEENRKLEKLLFQIESSLRDRVKLSVVSTSDDAAACFENIESDWDVTTHFFTLSEIGHAIDEVVSEGPIVCEKLDFTLPVTTSDGSVGVEILPEESRWINAELEVLYQTIGDTPERGSDDGNHFYRGGTISWYALNSGYALERECWQPIKSKIDDLVSTAGTLRLKLPHGRGTGGTTSGRKILFDYHKSYPCVNVRSIHLSEIVQAIKVLADFCKRPVLVLIDCKHFQGEEFELETLYTNLSNFRVHCILLEIIHSHSTEASNKGCKELVAAGNLNDKEAEMFVEVYSALRKEKTSFLKKIRKNEKEELQIPFYYGLVTFEEQFLGLEPFVEDCIKGSNKQQRQVLIFLALAYYYGHTTISEATLTAYFNAPFGISLESVLKKESMQLLIEEDGKWRPRHDLIGSKLLKKLLTYQEQDLQERIHNDNWIHRVADATLTFISFMPETVVSDVLLTRISSYEKHEKAMFSDLVNDIPDDDDIIRVFEKAIDLFPDNMFFKVHLGRYYSNTKKLAGFTMALKYTDEGIECTDSDTPRVVRSQFLQMKGVVYSRQVTYLIRDEAAIDEIIPFAEEGVKWFRQAVSICSDLVDAYIPEVSMMCHLFEYIHKVTGNVHEYLKKPSCHPFILNGISNTLDTLECVPDSERYTFWKMRVLNFGLRNKGLSEMRDALAVLVHLKKGKKASIGLINRQIAITKMEICRLEKNSLTTVAKEVVELLNEALACDKRGMERIMSTWVRIAPFVPVEFSEAETRIFKWCAETKSLRSYFYQYIVAFINVLDRGRQEDVNLVMSTHKELTKTFKAITRKDIGIVHNIDKPVIYLGKKSEKMGQLVNPNIHDIAGSSYYKKTPHILPLDVTVSLRRLTGRITRTDQKLGNISIDGLLDIPFKPDLCSPPLNSVTFKNKKVEFFLSFNFFGAKPYNVSIVEG